VTHAFVHEHLRPLHRYVVKPVIDLAGQAPADAYEVPDRLREAVHLMAPADVFPFASAPSRSLDLDHNVPYGAGGTTRLGNLGPLSRLHHRTKTHGHWTVRQPFEGVYVWRDPHGRVYVVDAGGTHAVPVGAQRASGSSSGARGTAVRRANSAAVATPVTSSPEKSASGP
jgi:hypothetical protein